MMIRNVGFMIGALFSLVSQAFAADPTFKFSQIDGYESRNSGGRYQMLVWGTAKTSYNTDGTLSAFPSGSDVLTAVIVDFGPAGVANLSFDHCVKAAALGGASTRRQLVVQALNLSDSNVTAPTASSGYYKYHWVNAATALGCRLESVSF